MDCFRADWLWALGGGVLAGIGLAAPLGAVGVLLLREGLMNGFRQGAPAASAVALVDAAYCSLAVAGGAAAGPVIASWGRVPALAGGAALIALGVFGLFRTGPATASGPTVSCAATDRIASGRAGFAQGPQLRRFGLFLGLTAVNPATLVYFGALTIGLGGMLSSPAGAVAFVAGVALASLAWQLGLVSAGAYLRGRITARGQRTLSLAGNCIVIALGLAALWALPGLG